MTIRTFRMQFVSDSRRLLFLQEQTPTPCQNLRLGLGLRLARGKTIIIENLKNSAKGGYKGKNTLTEKY